VPRTLPLVSKDVGEAYQAETEARPRHRDRGEALACPRLIITFYILTSRKASFVTSQREAVAAALLHVENCYYAYINIDIAVVDCLINLAYEYTVIYSTSI